MPLTDDVVQEIKALYTAQKRAQEKLETDVPIERVFQAALIVALRDLQNTIYQSASLARP